MTTGNTPIKGTRFGSGALAKAVLTSAKCRIIRLYAYNSSASTVFIQVHDSASEAAEGATPSYPSIPLLSGQSFESDTPRTLSAGAYVCASSTAATKTLIAADEVQIAIEIA